MNTDAMTRPHFFGYGSLVNRRTHDYPGCAPARLRGWRREWQPSPLRSVAFLNVVPDDAVSISGLIAEVPRNDWAALDQRERAYRRVPLDQADLEHGVSNAVVEIYSADRVVALTPAHPILLSYIDVVVQGFIAEHGVAGAEDFFDTTTGWHGVIRDDRAAPIYPRHQALEPAERAFVDRKLSELSAIVE